MKNPIIEMSFVQEEVSSRINMVAEELKTQHPQEKQTTLPDRYDINRLVILPVNPWLIFSYWFTTGQLKQQLKEKYGNLKVVLKLFEEKVEKACVEVGTLEGSWYIHYHSPFGKVRAVLGIDEGGVFYPLLHSNEIVMPSDTVFVEEEQHWYSKKDSTIRIKKADIQFIDQLNLIAKEKEKSSPPAGPSSVFLR